VADGKRIERVRVVTEPNSDYVRWSLRIAGLNIAAGEDIRYLPRMVAGELDLPNEDYWLFDSCRVAILRFDGADRLLGVELVEEPTAVVERCYRRDAAWHQAIRWRNYSPS
jgi:hypothetical protein